MRYPDGNRTRAKPESYLGYDFYAYRAGVMNYVRYCPELDAEFRQTVTRVSRNRATETYSARVGGEAIKSAKTGKAQRFLTRQTAGEAAVREALKRRSME